MTQHAYRVKLEAGKSSWWQWFGWVVVGYVAPLEAPMPVHRPLAELFIDNEREPRSGVSSGPNPGE